jgi:hypothetical protein
MSVSKRKLDHLRKKLAERKVRRVRSTLRHETFHVRHVRRTYDRTQDKFLFNISYQTAVKLTKRSLAVAEAFGLGVDEERKFTVLETELKVGQGDVRAHPRFMKAFSYHLPFGAKQTYREQIEHLNTEKLAHLIKMCGFLMQTKVYLFWRAVTKKREDLLASVSV